MKDRTPLLRAGFLFILSALLLTVIQPPIDWSFLAWMAFVPFALACSPQVKARTLVLAAFIVGYVYWLVNLYWIQPITTLGWLGMGLYLSLFWLLPAMTVRFARSKGIPLFIALPILVAGFERMQGRPMGGFFWRFLGHSQYENLALIQVADLVGVAGISFVVALVNGLLADLIVKREAYLVKRTTESSASRLTLDASRPLIGGVVVTLAVVTGTLLYGQWRLGQTPAYVTDGPLVGSLQSNVPQSVKQSYSAGAELFDGLMVHSKAAAAAGAELIVWPETMVQGILDPALWPYLKNIDEDKAFHKALAEHAKDTAWLLVGAHGAEIKWDDSDEAYLETYNSAYFYRPDGTRDPGRYDKIHLVLFGEYIPFKKWFPWLFKWFMPEGYHPSLTLEKGKNYTLFAMDPEQTSSSKSQVSSGESSLETSNFKLQTGHRFAVIICYEDTIPYVARNFTLDEQGRKQIDWLVNISNDGWFVQFPEDEGRVVPSSELPQHAAICAFRAVENRLAVIRSVNTGISCLIESTGRIRDGYLAASEGFPREAMARTAMTGWFLDRLPIDSRVTFYSRHGEWFANGCAAVFVGMVLWPLAAGWRVRRRTRRTTKAA
ncbi:MAG: apolipoprotein N-acyltransferase [Sedimentisphaerales bacterium]|nr:apolipoprotein N-acyltransferase [Sedimentisphaerales bacterium]